jgi:hypothetical protein
MLVNPDRFADHLMSEIIKYGSLHVGRVGPWVGLILMAIKRIASDTMEQNRLRQLVFVYRGRHFKVRYNHKAEGTQRGGIELVEYLPTHRGAPEIDVVLTIIDLESAESFYLTLERKLDVYIDAALIPGGMTQVEIETLISKGKRAKEKIDPTQLLKVS